MRYSVDVEEDLHTGKYEGIKIGLKRFETLCDKHKIKPILFVTGETLKNNPKIFQKLSKKGWEISFHGLSHKRFDEMSYGQKEKEIKEGIRLFEKILKIKPKGFRAPQHSINDETLDLLDKYGFEYDSSYTPLNLLQLLFFPRKFGIWFKHFFSKPNKYKIRKNLIEYPSSSFFMPFVSFSFRIIPLWLLKIQLFFIKLIYKEPLFYCHSWDFIEMKNSKTDRLFSHEKFLYNLDKIMEMKND
jgi:hypothetical protein